MSAPNVVLAVAGDFDPKKLGPKLKAFLAKLPRGAAPVGADGHGPGQGDLERAVLEWRSTLQLIAHGPAHPSLRWQQLRAAAQDVLGQIIGQSAPVR